MGINLDLHKLSARKSVTLSTIVFSVVVLPMFFIFQFQPGLFYKVDLLRLLIIALGYGVPFNFVCMIIAFMDDETGEKIVALRKKLGLPAAPEVLANADEEADQQGTKDANITKLLGIAFDASALASFIILIPCASAYFWPETIRAAIGFCIIIYIVFFCQAAAKPYAIGWQLRYEAKLRAKGYGFVGLRVRKLKPTTDLAD